MKIELLVEALEKQDPVEVLRALLSCLNGKVLIPVGFSWDKKEQKVRKKPLVKFKQKNFTPQECQKWIEKIILNYQKNRYYQGLAINFDHDCDFVVIDIDNVQVFHEKVQNIEEFLRDIKEVSPLIVKTLQKGYHVYIYRSLLEKFIPYVNNGSLLKECGFEIRYQGLIIIPPSCFKYNGKLYSYKVLHLAPENLNLPEETILNNPALQKILKILENCKFEIEKENLQREYKAIQRRSEKYKELKKIIEEVRKRVSFAELIPEHFHKSYSHYDTYHCPFHPPDRHPSFAVLKTPDGVEIAKDFHDQQAYDVISFWQKYKGLGYISALKELCEKAGIKFPEFRTARKEKQKKLEIIAQETFEKIWNVLNISEVFYTYEENGTYIYEIFTQNRNGKKTSFQFQAGLMVDPFMILSAEKQFLKFFGNATGKTREIREIYLQLGNLPQKSTYEVRKKVWIKIFERIEELAKDGTQNSLLVQALSDMEDFIRDAKTTSDWNEFVNDESFVKYVDENGITYLRFKSLYRLIQRISPMKNLYTEKKVFKLLRNLGAQMVRLMKNGKRLRLWQMPPGNWILEEKEEETKIEKIQPELEFENQKNTGKDEEKETGTEKQPDLKAENTSKENNTTQITDNEENINNEDWERNVHSYFSSFTETESETQTSSELKDEFDEDEFDEIDEDQIPF